MKLNTNNFGTIEIESNDIITFKDGIPGFEAEKQFIEILNQDETNPFHWLQSVNDTSISLVVVNPFMIKEDYEFKLEKEVINELHIETEEDVAVLSVVVVPEKVENMTMNLAAPIIINTKTKKGLQYIIENSQYSIKHRIIKEITKPQKENEKGNGADV